MTSIEELTTVSFEIIAAVGDARSSYVEAIAVAREGDLARAEELFSEGDESFLRGHEAHTKLIQQEAAGDPVAMTLMLTHAEDQLMSAETLKIVAEQFIDLYRKDAQEG